MAHQSTGLAQRKQVNYNLNYFTIIKLLNDFIYSVEYCKYNLPEISKISKKLIDLGRDISIPTYIFQNRKYTILEALIVYLRERKKLSFRKIAKSINRDLRYVYNSYQNAKKKELITKYILPTKLLQIPVSIFVNRKLSALEVLVSYLKERYSLSYHEIAILLKRDDRTIWTVYHRAQKKRKHASK